MCVGPLAKAMPFSGLALGSQLFGGGKKAVSPLISPGLSLLMGNKKKKTSAPTPTVPPATFGPSPSYGGG